jgi:hypothetical protein
MIYKLKSLGDDRAIMKECGVVLLLGVRSGE